MARIFISIGSLAAMFGVMFGALGAHGLRAGMTPHLLAIYETGVQYNIIHALGLILVGLVARAMPASRLVCAAGWLLAAGIVLFSGSLYVLALSGQGWWGMVTPFGGSAFILGWLTLALAAFRGAGL